MKKVFAISVSMGLIFGGSALVAAPVQAADRLTVTLSGDFGANGATKRQAKKGCSPDGDVGKGSKVRVTNESGKVVGLGRMKWKTGKVEDRYVTEAEYLEEYPIPPEYRYEVVCRLQTKMTVGSAKFYDITIDGVDAGTYSRGELKADKWKLNLSYS